MIKIKVGRLSSDIFENIFCSAYGEKTPISELSQIVPMSNNQVVLNVYDETLIS
jgi:ribosome recycling factor